MSGGKLSALQLRVLELLSALAPPWTLSGGGALAGFHLKHRTTRDLDLFWHGLQQLESLPEEVRSRPPHEILVNKLNALLSRSELRDLEDVRALLAAGGDLEKALADASKKDGGFSPLTLSWVLTELRPASLAQVAGVDPEKAQELETFRDLLVERILELSSPEGEPGRQ